MTNRCALSAGLTEMHKVGMSMSDISAIFGVVLPESFETGEVLGSYSRGDLHFDGYKVRWCIDAELHLQPGARTRGEEQNHSHSL